MGAYDDLQRTVFQSFMDFATIFGLGGAGKQGKLHGHVLEQFLEGGVMLGGQDFCRGHHTGLVAVVESQQHHHQGHDGLAATHVTLQQTVHLVTAAKIDADLTNDTFLSIGQREGEVILVEGVEVVTYLAKYIALVETLAAFFGP